MAADSIDVTPACKGRRAASLSSKRRAKRFAQGGAGSFSAHS